MAWGPWSESGMAADGLGEADWARLARLGISGMTNDEALTLLDLGVATGKPTVVPVRLDLAGLRVRGTEPPALLRGLVRVAATAAPAAQGEIALRDRLAELPEGEYDRAVLDFVRGQVALVLGLPEAGQVDAGRAFRDLGFDSLIAVELRNRLVAATGLRLSPTVVFEYPTAQSLAGLLGTELAPKREDPAEAAFAELESALTAVSRLDPDLLAQSGISGRLRDLLSRMEDERPTTDDLDTASDDELFQLVDARRGSL
jgi:acyl carrier protein